MVQSNVSTGGAYNYAASTFHIPAVLLERGCMGTWEREEVDSMRRDVRNILCSIGAYNGIPFPQYVLSAEKWMMCVISAPVSTVSGTR